MANHKSAIKRIRQTERRNDVNQRNRTQLRVTQVKKLDTAIASGSADDAKAAYTATTSAIDKSVQKGVVTANKAGRMKSRLNARVKALG